MSLSNPVVADTLLCDELVRCVGDWFVDHGKSKQHTECMVHVPAKTQSNPAKSYALIVSFLFTLSVLSSILIIVGSFEDDPDTGQDLPWDKLTVE